MQRIDFANKSTSKNQKTEQVEKLENSREVKGGHLSQTRNVFYLLGSKDTYYVQSERSNDIYYLVRFNGAGIEYCTCPDSSIRLEKCKHIWSIEKSIAKGTLKEIEKFNGKTFANTTIKSWKDGQYDF